MEYTTIAHFHEDMTFFKKDPGNESLLNNMVAKIHNSKKEIQDRIINEVIFVLLETNPEKAIEYLALQYPDHWILINSIEDPYFDC